MSARAGVLAAILISVALIGSYVALGGGSYEPLEVEDPCEPRLLSDERTESEQIALSALDGAACELRVTREDLALALASEEAREGFLEARYVSDEELAEAGRAGLVRAVEDAEELGTISAIEAEVIEAVVSRLPYERVVELLGTITGEEPLEAFSQALEAGADVGSVLEGGVSLDEIESLLP